MRDRRRSAGSLVGIGCVVAFTLTFLVPLTALSPTASATVRCRATSTDSDNDSIPDCWERRNGLVVGRRDHLTDKDHDGLRAIDEFRLDAATGGIFGPYRANVANSDDDGGFVKDGWIQPTIDGWEDFDGDGFVNTAERAWRTNAALPGRHPRLPDTGCVTMPRGVASDGSTNVTLLMQAVLDSVPDGRCLRFRLDGRYRHDGTLTLAGRNDLTIDGNGAVLFTDRRGRILPGAPNSKRSHVRVIAGSNVTIKDLSIDGPNRRGTSPDIYESEHGFNVMGAAGLTIVDSSVRQVYGDFVYIDDVTWPFFSGIMSPTSGLLVLDNTFKVAGRHGLGVSGNAVGVRFEGNLVQRVQRSGVDFELHPARAISNIEIVGNTFRAFNLNWIAAGSGPATDIYIGFNQILGDSMHLKMGPRDAPPGHERWTFEGNVSNFEHRSDREVFFVRRTHGVTFIGNVQPMYPGGGGRVFGIYDDVCGITLIDNSFLNYQVLFYPVEPPPC